MDNSVYSFMKETLTEEYIFNKKILNVGSKGFQNNIKEHILNFKPLKLIGIDIVNCQDVDIVTSVENMLIHFTECEFDLVLCNDVLEHIFDWRTAINNIKKVCKIGGIIIITVPGIDFPRHEDPGDFWRFTAEDFKLIFKNFFIIDLFESQNRKIQGISTNFQGTYLIVKKLSNGLIDLQNYNIRKI